MENSSDLWLRAIFNINALQVQYVLCHEVLADYLESFDTYANFKEVM